MLKLYPFIKISSISSFLFKKKIVTPNEGRMTAPKIRTKFSSYPRILSLHKRNIKIVRILNALFIYLRGNWLKSLKYPEFGDSSLKYASLPKWALPSVKLFF